MAEIVVLTLSSNWDGKLHEYVTSAMADKAVTHFGRAVSVSRESDEQGSRWLVECSTARGDTGANRMHEIACAYRIPCHVA
jgi:hypothetical protein